MKYIDIHSHILPGVDDGARDLNQTLAMLKLAESQGIDTMIITPHYHPRKCTKSKAEITAVLGQVREAAAREKIEIRLFMGSELYYTTEAAKMLQEEYISTLAGSRYVLVEFSTGVEFDALKNGLYQLQLEGYFPILAHIERYRCMVEGKENAQELSDMGVYIQVNADSVSGDAGRKEKNYIKDLMKRDLVDFIATDAHDERHRAPVIEKCVRQVEKKFGAQYVKRLLRDNPGKVLADEVIG